MFLVGSIILGQLLAKNIGKLFSKIHSGAGMKFTVIISFGLVFAYLASIIGLAPIVGAFAAGLILDPVHFKFFKDPKVVEHIKDAVKDAEPVLKGNITKIINKHSDHNIEELINPIGYFLIPIFFVVTGMAVKLETMFDMKVLSVALALTIVAFIGKIIAGFVAGKGVNKILIGFGMVPRGEVGLIFATIGKTLGVVSDEVFSIIVIMVILTTLLTPPILTYLLKKSAKNETPVVA
ncbi:MAG: Sodium/hydrogen exchanger [uncultured bacterium]|nr:MAG: Sodium/hydrogen exchanger [uncultured bacterium]